MSDNGLEVVKSRRMNSSFNNDENSVVINNGNNKLANSIADNFGNILELAGDIVEIQKMKTQSNAVLEKMREDRKTLVSEAEAYAKKKNADTNSVVEKMKVIQEMMRDFYQQNNSSMSGEDFSKVISEIVTQMGRID